MAGMDFNNKTTGEIVEMMRDKVQELVDANGSEISASDALKMLTEAILIGAAIIGSVKDEPISIVLGSMAGIALESELVCEIEAVMERANIARMN